MRANGTELYNLTNNPAQDLHSGDKGTAHPRRSPVGPEPPRKDRSGERPSLPRKGENSLWRVWLDVDSI
jgi:hypothetical protein